MSTLLLVVIVVGAAIEHIAVLGIHLDDQISILAFGTAANIVLMHLVIGHKVADLCFVGADPKIQAVVFIELILQRESADRTTQIEKIYGLHVDLLG